MKSDADRVEPAKDIQTALRTLDLGDLYEIHGILRSLQDARQQMSQGGVTS